MAKIVYITDQLSDTMMQIAKSMSDLQNDVTIITTKKQKRDGNLEIWSYFSTWSALEILKLIPKLLKLKPATVHFMMHDPKFSKNIPLLGAVFRSIPNCIIGLSLLRSKNLKAYRKEIKKCIELSDLVTFPDLDSMGLLKGTTTARKQQRALMPPFLTKKTKTVASNFKMDNAFILVAWDPENLNHISAQNIKTILGASGKKDIVLWINAEEQALWQKKSTQEWLISKKLQNRVYVFYMETQKLAPVIAQASGFLLQLRDFSAEGLRDILSECIQTNCLPILNERQASQYSYILNHQVNAFVVGPAKSLASCLEFLQEQSRENKSEKKKLLNHHQFIDHHINEISRLYQKAHQSKEF